MVKIDYEEYDIISTMEDVIKSIISSIGLQKAYISMRTYEQQVTYILTIISILYKEKCYEEYLGKNVNGKIDDIAVNLIYEVIDTLREQLENDELLKATRYIKENGYIIETFLQRYFEKKSTNYITKKHALEIVKSQNNQHELLEYNPFTINQLLTYENKPLTKEEIMIQEITEFLVESEQTLDEKREIFANTKELMKKNYDEKKLNEVISFIISNSYQELMEHLDDENRNIIIPIIENPNVNPKDIIDHFKEKDSFSNMFIQIFVKYNLTIKEGRLKELEEKPSKKYAKKIYQK